MPIGAPEMIVILIVALIVLGPKRLPAAGRSLGQGLREFKESVAGGGSAGTDRGRATLSAEASEARVDDGA